MNINLNIPSIKISPLKTKMQNQKPSFKGLQHDVFEKSVFEKILFSEETVDKIAKCPLFVTEMAQALENVPSEILEVDTKGGMLFDEYIEQKKAQAVQKHSEYIKAYRNYYRNKKGSKEEVEKLHKEASALKDEKWGLIAALRTDEIKTLIFEQHKKRNPNVAFLYDPSLGEDEKKSILLNKPEIINVSKTDSKYYPFINHWHDKKLLDIETFNREQYVDTSFPFHRQFLDDFEEKRKDMPKLSEVARKYNIYDAKLAELINNKKLSFIGLYPDNDLSQITHDRLSWHVNMDSELTRETLDSCSKTIPTTAGKYYKGLSKRAELVPAGLLSKLGFGSPREIAELIRNKTIKGYILSKTDEEGKKKYKVLVDINNDRTEEVLKTLRYDNENTFELKQLAKFLGMKPRELEKYFADGKGQIVKHYLFSDDFNKVFVNLENPSNKELLDAVQEKKMAAIDKEVKRIDSIVEKRRQARMDAIEKDIAKIERAADFSLKMKLVWSFCDNVRKTASTLAAHDPYLASIFEKIEEGKELTCEEKHDYLAYCKQIWGDEEREEFKQGFQLATEVIQKYRRQGIDSIEDPKIKEIILNHKTA